MLPTFEVLYAVPMTCQDCVDSIRGVLKTLPGVESYNIYLDRKELFIRGNVLPSRIVEKMQDIGRDAFVRGSGKPDSSAVCILENSQGSPKGLVRIVATGPKSSLFDVSLSGIRGATLSVHQYGDISRGPQSAGDSLFEICKAPETFGLRPVSLPSLIGRSIVADSPHGSLVGVIARSAGLWENDKQVCSCSGQTLWQERENASIRL